MDIKTNVSISDNGSITIPYSITINANLTGDEMQLGEFRKVVLKYFKYHNSASINGISIEFDLESLKVK